MNIKRQALSGIWVKEIRNCGKYLEIGMLNRRNNGYRSMSKPKFCIKCEYSLHQCYLDTLGESIGYYCDREKCPRRGLLTNVWIESE